LSSEDITKPFPVYRTEKWRVSVIGHNNLAEVNLTSEFLIFLIIIIDNE
jgi:hypothetical protein